MPVASQVGEPLKVQAMMETSFEGRPITEDNLSEWKNGGYVAWAAGQRVWDNVWSFMDGTAALQGAIRDGYDGSINPELTRPPEPQNRPQSASIGPNRSKSE